MERYIKTEAVVTRDGEFIPLFMLRAEVNEDYSNNEIDLIYDKSHQTFTCDNLIEVFYDLLEKRVVCPYGREVKIFREAVTNYAVGDKVTVEIGVGNVYIDTIKEILPGRIEFINYMNKDEFNFHCKNERIIEDKGDKNSPLVRVEYVCEKYILEKGEVIDYEYKIKKIVEKK